MATFGGVSSFHRYGDSLVVGGDYAFVSWVSSDWRFKVGRVNLTTGESDGVVDLGALPFNDFHFYASLAIDPTDNCLVWCRAGRPGGGVDYRTAIRKTANAYGGTAEQWVAGDFGSLVSLPYPNVGIISYAHMTFTEDGTLLILGGNRTALANPGGNAPNHGGYLYRYLGDGTPKTATQLASGTWAHLLAAVPDVPPSLFSGVIYPAQTVYKDGRYAVAYHYFETLLDASADNYAGTSPRKALAYVYSDNITATTPAWKRIDGATLSTPIANDAAKRSTAQFVHDGYGDYFGSIALGANGDPFFVQGLWTLDSTTYKNHLYTGLSGYTWDGSQWVEHVLYPNGVDKIHGASPTTRAFYHSAVGKRQVLTTRLIDGVSTGKIVADDLDSGAHALIGEMPLSTVQLKEYGTATVYAGVNDGSLYVGTEANHDFDVLPPHNHNALFAGAGF